VSATTVTVEQQGHILLIGLNRPDKRNAIGVETFHQLAAAYTKLDRDPELRCGVLFAHGKHFTGGIDLPEWIPHFSNGDALQPDPDMIDP
jgi:enoyl-CoA hydratase/carnithine racemase